MKFIEFFQNVYFNAGDQAVHPPAQVATALSAAVTGINGQETAPDLHGSATTEEVTKPIPSRFPGGSAREGPFSERPPPSHFYTL